MSFQSSPTVNHHSGDDIPRDVLTRWILTTTEAEQARTLIPAEDEIAEFCRTDSEVQRQIQENALSTGQVAREMFRKEWLKATLDVASRDVLPPTEEDVRRYYDSHPDNWYRKEARHMFHILITVQEGFPENTEQAALSRIQELSQKIQEGAPFGTLASQHSECPTALQEGELGWVSRDQMFEELSDAAFSLELGLLSQPVRSRLGYHLLLCTEARPEGYEPFENVAERLGEALLKRRKLSRQRTWVQQLAKERSHAS